LVGGVDEVVELRLGFEDFEAFADMGVDNDIIDLGDFFPELKDGDFIVLEFGDWIFAKIY
jgi:hypothetical protein